MSEIRRTAQQQAVVENRGGTLLVSAAAGSGKTKVLVDRVLSRVVDEGHNINEFLIITFTNAAAAELRGKIAAALSAALAAQPDNRHLARQMNLLQISQISTVHAFCGALLREYGYLLEVPADYRMLEDDESAELLSRLLEELLEERYETAEPGFLLLADTLGAGRSDQALTDEVLELYDKLQSQPDPQRWLQQQQTAISGDTELSETVWGRLLTASARRQLQELIARYDWAISRMEGDELLEKQYLPCYRMQRQCLQDMLPALEGPWDEIASRLTMDYPRVAVRNYPDQGLLEAVKAVKSDGKDLLERLGHSFGRRAETLRQEQNQMAPALDALLALLGELDRRFSAEKRRKNLLDFSDQEHLAIRLLRHRETGRPTEVAQEVARRYVEIMVDEYQDSNRVQEMIFTAVAAPGCRFLVGDIKQSIYGFRQAEPEMFLEKYLSYPPADRAQEGQPRHLVLSRNFRSRPEILEAVNHVFASVMSEQVGGLRYDGEQRLYAGLEEYPETGRSHVELHLLDLQKQPEGSGESKYQREALWVAGRIAAMLEEGAPVRDGGALRPVRPSDIAVLLRTRDPISVYSRTLRRAGIPVASGGGEKLFETPEVKMLVSLLRVLSNPHQDIPLLAVLCSPVFRLTNSQLAEIRAGSREKRFYDAMRQCDQPWCRRAVERLEELRAMAQRVSADTLVWSLLHETGLLAACSAMDQGQQRRENLMEIYELARKGASGGFLYLYQLLRILDRAEESGLLAAGEAEEGVTITTMHRSKGLEYPVVFLADLSRKFNFRELNGTVLFDGDLGLGAKLTDTAQRVRYPGLCFSALRQKKQQALLSEELRILYVAMTRPKDYLIMTYAGENTQAVLNRLWPGAGCPAEPWAAAGASCLGDWVLLSALSRVEAGELFARSSRPQCRLTVSDFPWDITFEEVGTPELPNLTPQETAAEPEQPPLPEDLAAQLRWRDPHARAALTPSKLTATQLKGRDKDTEAAENAQVRARTPQLRRPEFVLETTGLSATERGTAVHLFLQYARFCQCTTEADVVEEKYRLEDGEFLTPRQLQAVEPKTIVDLFASPLGQRMLASPRLIREFKFSILEDASDYYPEVRGEQVLLQGVVDAAMEEDDGLVVVDFKTDRVTETTISSRTEHYRGQLVAYQRALERIFNKPVKEMWLYFLAAGKAVKL